MNQINLKSTNSFFFFVDSLENNDSKYLKIDNFFFDSTKLHPNIYFSVFCNSKMDFDFLEKNDKLISFFLYDGKFFFKDQIKNLKTCFLYEDMFRNNIEKKLNLSFFLNFFYFFRNIYCFFLLLKKLSFIKKEKCHH